MRDQNIETDTVADPASARMRRRREKVVAEITRNRRGQYRVPTWVLVSMLITVVAAWAAVIIVGSS